jgi:hypothetical protein
VKFRHSAVTATADTASALAFTPGAASAALRAGSSTQNLGSLYGAVAYSPSNHSVVAAGGGKGDYIPLGWSTHAYMAFYPGSGNAWAKECGVRNIDGQVLGREYSRG